LSARTRYNREIGQFIVANKVHAFRDRDIKRIVKSIEVSTGKPARRVEVDPRTGRVVVDVDSSASTTNTWDELLTDAEDPKRPA
jgi:hypothetical protein